MRKTSLKEIANIVMGISPSSKSCNFNSEGYPLLNGPSEFGSHHPTAIQFTEDPKKFSQKGDLLFCVRGSTGRMNWSDQKYAIGRGLAAIQSKNGQLYSSFIKGCIERELPNLLASSTGSVFSSVNRTQLEEITIHLPSDKDITAIENILSSLERKIELIKNTNETLEGIAKALFKSWFIDFDPVRAKADGRSTGLPDEISDLFPDSFTDSELGAIPFGWNVSTIGSISKNFDKKRIPLSKKDRSIKKGGFPYYGATGIFDYVDNFLFDGIYLLIGEDGSVEKENGTAFTQYVEGKIWVNNHAHVLKGIDPISTEFLYCFFQFFKINPFITGAVQLKLSQGRMNMIPLPIADKNCLEIFDQQVKPIFSKIILNNKQCLALESIRDTLLPKLISGELRIPDAEKMIEEAGI